jgi:transglutaminase-like putative cysteine protease
VPQAAEAAEPSLREWLDGIPGRSFVDESVAEPAPRVETRIAPLRLPPGVLFSPAAPWLVRIEADGLRVASSVLDPPAEGPGLYGIVHGVGDGVEGEAGGFEPSAALLALPADTDPRLRALARVLGEGDPSAAARVARTAGYLGAHCRYSLAPGAFRGPQPVAEFVFEKKKGYCEYFASAAAVLLRLQGVPARYVAGFNVTDDDLVGGHYVVREANAHAWIDAYLPGRGWVEVDPTPAAEYAALRGPMRGSGLAAAWDALGARAAGLWIALRFGAGRSAIASAAAGTIAAALALRFGRRWLRRARARPRARPAETTASVPPEITGLLARADRLWARRGFPRPPHRAPLEHLQSLPPDRIEAGALRASRDAVECYYRARFGGIVPERDEVAGLARRLP